MPVAVVGGALANKPFVGGEAWVRLSWVLGLRRLGFDVYFAEQLSSEDCVDESGGPADFAASANRAYFDSVVRDFGLEGRAGVVCDGGAETSGLGLDELVEAAAGADVLFNLSGHLSHGALLAGPRTTVYVDLDPGYTQAWHADPAVPFRIAPHDRYATVGTNVGRPGCPIPPCGLDWIPTLPPLPLDEWPPQPPPAGPLRLTTVATWRSAYGEVRIGGRTTAPKHRQHRRLLELPERLEGVELELALDIHPGDSADREALIAHGWKLAEPRRVARTPQAFREYVGASGGELSAAQGAYVETGSGWFSDRTAAYLAAGRPAVVQATGLRGLPRDRGLFGFDSLDAAVSAVEAVAADPAEQGAAARELAERRLDSDVVLGRLLSIVGVGG